VPLRAARHDRRDAPRALSAQGGRQHAGQVREVDCPRCGTRSSQDERFCGNCGWYLKPGDGPDPPSDTIDLTDNVIDLTEPTAASAASHKGVLQRAREAVGWEGHSGLEASRDATPGDAEADEGVPPATVGKQGSGQPETDPPDITPDGKNSSPGPVLPGTPIVIPPPTPQIPVEEPPAPGELICGDCGTGNIPSRNFCRRCGHPLADAVVAGRPPWWKRLFARRNRPPAAGTRPRRKRRRGWARKLIPLVLIGGIVFAGWHERETLKRWRDDLIDRIHNVEPAHPDAASSSSNAPRHPAGLAVDSKSNTYWAPRQPGPAVGEYLRFTFAEPVDLRDVDISGGRSAKADEFLTMARPAKLLMRLRTESGEVRVVDIALQDKAGPQRVGFKVDRVTAVRIEVVATKGVSAGRRVAIAEVEFFRQSGSAG
jgi:hypothetical protein